MNILFITNLKSLYGANRSLLDLVKGLRDFDITPYIITPDHGTFTNALEAEKIIYTIMPVPSWVRNQSISLYQQKRLIQQMFEISNFYLEKIVDWNIDIIETNSSTTPIGSLAALRSGLKHVWHVREFLDLHYGLQYIFPRWIALQFITKSSNVICVSNAIKEHYFLKNTRNIHVVNNGVLFKKEFKQNSSKKQINEYKKPYIFSMVGLIHPNKGQLNAIEAILRITKAGYKAKLYIAGDGDQDYIKKCKDFLEIAGLNFNVSFLGYVDNPYDVYKISNCLLMCSDYEAMGRVTAEAMACSLPVIGKKSGGTPEIIDDGVSGYLYNTDDELVNYMINLIENPTIGIEMGKNGWTIAKEKFSIENYAEKIFTILNSL